MNREDIIRMAEQCGIPEFENNESQADNIILFAKTVSAAEARECMKICEKEADDLPYGSREWLVANLCAVGVGQRAYDV